jgi:hypothetical protein
MGGNGTNLNTWGPQWHTLVYVSTTQRHLERRTETQVGGHREKLTAKRQMQVIWSLVRSGHSHGAVQNAKQRKNRRCINSINPKNDENRATHSFIARCSTFTLMYIVEVMLKTRLNFADLFVVDRDDGTACVSCVLLLLDGCGWEWEDRRDQTGRVTYARAHTHQCMHTRTHTHFKSVWNQTSDAENVDRGRTQAKCYLSK